MPALLKGLFNAIQQLNQQEQLLAYHDRSDGGLFVTLCEMAFAGHCGVRVDIASLGEDAVSALYSEELGVLVQVATSDTDSVMDTLRHHGLAACSHIIGAVIDQDEIVITRHDNPIFQQSRIALQRIWSETTYQMQTLRDNPQAAQQEFDLILDAKDPGIKTELSFDINENVAAPL